MRRWILLVTISFGLAACQEQPPSASGTAPVPAPAPAPALTAAGSGGAAAAAVVRVNLNRATEEQFLAIPEVTPRMAHEFDEYRPYASIRQFRREIGKYVDAEQVARYERFVFVPIDRNESDAATLQQISGLDETRAEVVIAGRPYGSNEAFLAALGSHVDAASVADARMMLAE